jgi:glycogen debranching enzyme
VRDLDGQILYENSFLQRDADRTFADFQVGTNKLPCTIDGAKRDRACFGGDVFVTGRSIAYSTADLDAWKGTIQLLLSHQNKDGYLGNLCPMQAPEHTGQDEPPYYGHYSLMYALLLVVSIKDYWLSSGDKALVERLFHQLERQMNFTRRFLNHDGLVEAPPYLSSMLSPTSPF